MNFPIIFRLFPFNHGVVWKTAAGLQVCLKQALHDRKQLLWWSLTKDFHENDKVEVKLRCFEVEVLPIRRSVTAYLVFEDIPLTQCKYSQFNENLNFKLT